MSDSGILETPQAKKKRDLKRERETRGDRREKETKRDNTILELKAKGLNHSQIAKVANCHPETVSRCIRKFKAFFDEVEEAEGYQEVRQKILNATEFKLLRSVTEDSAIEKAPLNQRAYALKEVHNMRRLNEGLSTSNTSLQVTKSELMPIKSDKYQE